MHHFLLSYTESRNLSSFCLLFGYPISGRHMFIFPKDVKLEGGASVVVVRPHANSLNNRLVPYDVIKTECVLQIDDDTRYLTREQIKHGFR